MATAPAMLGSLARTVGAPGGPPGGSFPLSDWQFWVVTLIALLAASWIVAKLLPRSLLGKRRRSPARRATLTVDGRPVEPPRTGTDCH